MNGKTGLITLVLATVGLGGCASMSGDECLTSDWSAIGYEDGARGYPTDRVANRRKACAKHGVTVDFAAYRAGRDQGLLEYCQPNRGFHVGANGGSYQGVCSVATEADFLDAYNAGHHLYTLRTSVSRASSSIHAKQNELDRIEGEIAEAELTLIAGDTTKEDRVRLLLDLKEYSERTGTLEAQIRELQDIRARSQAELEQYEYVVADMGY